MIKLYNIPAELKQIPRWVGYKLGPLKENNKKDKFPIDLNTGNMAKVNDERTFTSFSRSLERYVYYRCDGIGFVFTPPYIGIDIDGSINLNIAKSLNSYTEWSPSKNGYHVIVKGSIPYSVKKPIEIYDSGRFFTFTGDRIPSFPTVINTLNGQLKEYYSSPTSTHSNSPSGWIQQAFEEMKPGNVDNTLTSIAGKLFKHGLQYNDVFGLLKDRANEAGHDDKNLHRICKSVERYHLPPKNSSQDWAQVVESPIHIDWLIEDVFQRGNIGFISGIAESGKTWLLMDLALEVARGGFFLGKKCKQGKVVYIDQERGLVETARRFRQLIKGKDLKKEDVVNNLKWRIGTSTKVDLDNSFEEFKNYLTKEKPDLILVDSLVKFHTRDENSRSELVKVLDQIKKLRDELGCGFIFIDHEGKGVLNPLNKDKKPNAHDTMGSAVKVQVAEVFLTVRSTGPNLSTVYHTKATIGSKIEPVIFEVKDLVHREKTVINIL